jgi:Eukaryotic protein of unknown function (DUF829)
MIQQAPNQVVRTTVLSEPRAVAIVLGSLGCSSETLANYGRMYSNRHCSVITAYSPPIRFLCNASLTKTAFQILNKATVILQDTPSNVPLVVHAFSNGGAFLLEEIEKQLLEHQQQPELSTEDKYNLFASRMKIGYQFFDSCPCYIRNVWDTTHVWHSFPHPHWSKYGRYIYTIGASLSLTVWCTLTFAWHRPQQFWDRMIQSKSCPYQIFMYSTTDLLSDAAAVDRFVSSRSTQGVHCSVYRFDDSNHCQLDKDHPLEYGKAIDDALQAVLRKISDGH